MIMGLLCNENVLYSFRLMMKLFFYSVPFFYIFFFGRGGGIQCSELRNWYVNTVDNLFKIKN